MDQHTNLVERAKEIFNNFGYLTILEEELPLGKGAPDIVARQNGLIRFVCEVKSSPTSPKSKKIARQFSRYKEHYGSDCIYLLISPDARNRVSVAELNDNYKGTLDEFLA